MSNEGIKQKADEIWKFVERPDEFVALVETADLAVVRMLISRLGSIGTMGAQFDARRDAAVAVLQSRLSENQVDSLERLNASTTHLAKVGIWVAAVAAAAAIVQLVMVLLK